MRQIVEDLDQATALAHKHHVLIESSDEIGPMGDTPTSQTPIHPSAPMIVTNHELENPQTSEICGLTIGAWSGLWIWMSGSGRAEALPNWEAM